MPPISLCICLPLLGIGGDFEFKMGRMTQLLTALMCLLMSSTVCVCVQGFSFPEEDSRHLNLSGNAKMLNGSHGILALDGGKSSDAEQTEALYYQPIQNLSSFASFFNFSSNSTYANGTLAFVFVLSNGIKALSIEIGNGGFGLAVGVNANNYNLFCHPDDNYNYEILVEYNATTTQLYVASPSCSTDYPPPIISFNLNLSSIIADPPYVGFTVSNGAFYNLSHWNFTAINATTPYLQARSLTWPPPDPPSTVIPPGNHPSSQTPPGSPTISAGSSNNKLGRGYVIAFSLLGAGIAVACVFVVWLLCGLRAGAKRSSVTTRRVERPRPILPQNYNYNMPAERDTTALNPPSAAAFQVTAERDTTALNPPSAFQVSGTASWLQPATAR